MSVLESGYDGRSHLLIQKRLTDHAIYQARGEGSELRIFVGL